MTEAFNHPNKCHQMSPNNGDRCHFFCSEGNINLSLDTSFYFMSAMLSVQLYIMNYLMLNM